MKCFLLGKDKLFFTISFDIVLSSLRTGDRVPLHCVDRHPDQQHVVATGGQDGMLSIWDVRQGTMPVSLLKAHEAESKYCGDTKLALNEFLMSMK
jgi:WD40 repeat protein